MNVWQLKFIRYFSSYTYMGVLYLPCSVLCVSRLRAMEFFGVLRATESLILAFHRCSCIRLLVIGVHT